MRGLVLKDLLSLKGTFMILAAFVAVYAVIGFVGNSSSMITGVLAIVVMMMPANSISYDEFYHWDRYVLTMPISRKMVVQSKYLFCFILAAFVFVVGSILSILVTGELWEGIFSNAFVALISLLISTIALPCMLKWGAQKGRMVIVFLCGAAGAVLAILMGTLKWGELKSIVGGSISMELLLVIVAVITAITVIISYGVSCKLYLHKQF